MSIHSHMERIKDNLKSGLSKNLLSGIKASHFVNVLMLISPLKVDHQILVFF